MVKCLKMAACEVLQAEVLTDGQRWVVPTRSEGARGCCGRMSRAIVKGAGTVCKWYHSNREHQLTQSLVFREMQT